MEVFTSWFWAAVLGNVACWAFLFMMRKSPLILNPLFSVLIGGVSSASLLVGSMYLVFENFSGLLLSISAGLLCWLTVRAQETLEGELSQ